VGGAKLVAVTAASYETDSYFLATLNPATGRHVALANISTKVGSGLLPCNLAISAAGVATVASLYSGLPQVASDGTLVDRRTFGADFLPVNMQRDRAAGVAIVQSYNLTTQQHTVHELADGADGAWTLRALLLPALKVQVGISAYCSKGRVLFLCANDDDDDDGSGTALLRVNVTSGLLLRAPVPMADLPTALAWDSSTATLYAWTGNETYPAMLVVVDPDTGRRVGDPVACFRDAELSFGATPTAIDEAARKLYTPLRTVTSPSRPVWSVVDLDTGSTDERLRTSVVLDLAWH
jgi:hypothetical protein